MRGFNTVALSKTMLSLDISYETGGTCIVIVSAKGRFDSVTTSRLSIPVESADMLVLGIPAIIHAAVKR